MPSPGMFGSLPTGLDPNPGSDGAPWQTLLFRPQDNHPQSTKSRTGQSPDHLLLDLFWMPVVEPYAISDRFSTAGKINMNYQIMPFSRYLKRSTGVRALLKTEKIAAIPTAAGPTYKENSTSFNMASSIRLAIDSNQTLSQFETKFAAGDVFKSASEICDIHIVPKGQSPAAMEGFWKDNILTGDNLRERIYTTLYPRLTTKSNTYTVHVRAQALRKIRGSVATSWDEGKDQVIGEYRGSVSIERFIDANNTEIPDYAAKVSTIPSERPLDDFYRWRVIENRQFIP